MEEDQITLLLRTYHITSDSSELDSASQLSTSKMDTTSSQSSSNQRSHHPYCDVVLRDLKKCTCADIWSMIRKQEEYCKKKGHHNATETSESFQSAILAGHLNVSSQQSSETSYYSAECTIPPMDSGNTDNSRPSIPESTCSSTNEILNQNIDTAGPVSTDASRAEDHAPDLNAAQNLFETLECENRDKTHSVDSSSLPPIRDESLNITSGTEYQEIRPFLRRLSRELSDEQSDLNDQQIISRLSKVYIDDPDYFAKRLVTIIEESDLRLPEDSTAVSLDHLLPKFKKSCKYIQDESMPVMPDTYILSPDGQSSHSVSHARDASSAKLLIEHSSTPRDDQELELFKSTPVNTVRNAGKSQASPLYISTLSRGINPATPGITKYSPITMKLNQTPLKQSPRTPIINTPGSGGKHNDSSFTSHEKYCGPGRIENCNQSDKIVDLDEFKRKSAKMEQSLARDSPVLSPRKKIICKSPQEVSKITEADEDLAISLPGSDDEEDDFTRSIFYELKKKRQRCFETQKTIREIDAESSIQTSDDNDSSLKLRNLLSNCTKYHHFLEDQKIKQAIRQHEDSGVDVRSGSSTFRTSRKDTEGKSSVKDHNVTTRKTPASSRSVARKRSPNVRTSLSARKITYSEQRKQVKSPTAMGRTKSASRSYLRSISPIDRPSSSISSSHSSLSSMPQSGNSFRTPRGKFTPLSIYSQTPVSTRSNTRTPGSATNSKLGGRITGQKPTPLKLSSKTVTKTVPTVTVTSCTPTEFGGGGGKFFNTPGRTPVPKVRKKPAAYFPTDLVKTKPLPSPIMKNVSMGLYGSHCVKSPVAAYIHGTDSTLIKNIQSARNEVLLTPRTKKSSKNSQDEKKLKLNLSAKRGTAQKCQTIKHENEENIPSNGYNHPEVHYQLPATVAEIKVETPITPRGIRAKRLMESEEKRVVTRHERHGIPRIRVEEDPDLSIHVTKSAEKVKFIARSKSRTKF